MNSPIEKRSMRVDATNTSVSLEQEFWDGLGEIATCQGLSRPELVRQIASQRVHSNLSSALRVHVLRYYESLARATAELIGQRHPSGSADNDPHRSSVKSGAAAGPREPA
jgi:predicted DNA-binding ribbon-helix-helix protein